MLYGLGKHLKKYRVQVILAPLFKLLEAVFELIIPIVVANIIDKGIPSGDTGYIWTQGGIMIGLGVVGLAFALTCQYMATRAGQGFATSLRHNMLVHVNTLSHRDLDRISASSLATRLTNDVNQMQQAVSMSLRLLTRCPFLIIGSCIGALMISPKISVIFFAAAPVIGIILYLIMSKSAPYYRASAKALDSLAATSRENLNGARVVRAFAKQDAENKRCKEAVGRLTKINIAVGRISILLNPLTSLVVNICIIAIVWLGGAMVGGGELEVGKIIALVNYMTQIQLSLIVLANLIVMFTRASASGARIKEVLDLKNTLTEKNSVSLDVRPAADTPLLSCEDVSFSYTDDGKNCLQDISFSLMRGQKLGIIGGTGSGKSTLVDLLPRFYDVNSGRILLDGVDITEYPLVQLRESFGLVPQKAVLFSGTIRSNMIWRKRDADDGEIWDALQAAQAKDFVAALPLGLNTPVSQNGRNFSGGQRQRLTIARALVGSPRILILDDSSSALDAATDKRLREALAKLDTTTIFISQRAHSLVECDLILVLENGRVVGKGNHASLLLDCPVYREIYASQDYSVKTTEADSGGKKTRSAALSQKPSTGGETL